MRKNRTILAATEADRLEILALYQSQIGREFCPWDEHYPGEEQISFDLDRDSLFVMKEEDCIIGAISIDLDEEVEQIPCWTPSLRPVGELSRLAIRIENQNQGIAREMILFAMDVLRKRGYKGVHFLVNKHNVKALRSYEHLAFENVGDCFYFEQLFWCYEKEL